MSRSNRRKSEYWYGFIKSALSAYPDGIDDNTKAGAAVKMAIEDQLEATKSMSGGADRIALMRMLLIDRTHTFCGAVSELYISERTASRWIRAFVYGIAKRLGFLDDTDV